ncbi:MAG: class I SAM-dependent methyltransferase [Acidimicrobiales bacterium]
MNTPSTGPARHDHFMHSRADVGATWNERYRTDGWATHPDDELVELVTPLAPAAALDLGCGTGRNAIWLAEMGWRVTGVDASIVGLDHLRQRADELELADPTTIVADLSTYEAPAEAFDLVVIANIHLDPSERDTFFSNAQRALKPGGYFYVIGHHLDALGLSGPPDPARLYTEEILRAAFADLEVERLERLERRLEDGGSRPVVDVLLWATKAPAVTR